MNQSNEHRIIVADAAAAAPQKSPPACFKLLNDCWDQIFEYFTLTDIYTMGQTCKRMHQIVGNYIRVYLTQHCFEFKDGRVTAEYPYDFDVPTGFYQFIKKLEIQVELNFSLDPNLFCSLDTLYFRNFKLTDIQLEYTQNVLKNVERIRLNNCIIYIDTLLNLANYCPKLKHLEIFRCDVDRFVPLQYYPALETLELQLWRGNIQFTNLKVFLETHSNLKYFECDFRLLWANQDSLCKSNLQLNVLTVHFHPIFYDKRKYAFFDFLQQLYARGFYKRLHLHFGRQTMYFDVDNLSDTFSTLPGLEKLITERDLNIDLFRLTNLKELHLWESSNFSSDWEVVAKNLKYLKCLSFFIASIDDILPFVCYSKSLKEIRIFILGNMDVDLFTLNEERKKLTNACPIVIYLRENVYMSTKLKSKNAKLSHVEIMRLIISSPNTMDTSDNSKYKY